MAKRFPSKSYARKLGTRIRALREEIGLTQERLAWSVDLDKGYMSQIESGKRLPSLRALYLLATELGVSPADLLAFDMDDPRQALLNAVRRNDATEANRALRKLGLQHK